MLPCFSRLNSLCCKQVKQTNIFKSYRTKQAFKIFHNLTNVKVKIFIYLLQCRTCKLQCIGKSEFTFKIRLSNDRKNAESEKSILARKHLNEPNHNF